jgi:nicotinamide mononucleotide transporter
MEFQTLIAQFMQQLAATSPWEWIAVAFGILQVLLALRNHVLLYPAGIISTICSIYLLAQVQLYAESLLNIYYLVMSIYGWIHWLGNGGKAELPITRASQQQWIITSAIVFIGGGALYFLLRNYTSSDVPFWDAIVSSTAWAGMWLLARRKLENWILLNISNIMAIPLQFHKQIPLYAMLTAVLFVVAIFGYFNWKKIMATQTAS